MGRLRRENFSPPRSHDGRGHAHHRDGRDAGRADVPAPLSPFSYVAPADLVLFLGITVLLLSSGVVESRRLGLLQRVAAAPAVGRGRGGADRDEPLRRRGAVRRVAGGRSRALRRALGEPGGGVPRAGDAVAGLCRASAS